MKTINNIAKHVLEHRQRPSMHLHTADLQEDIGVEGMAECRERGWVVPDIETGFMMVTQNMTTIQEMYDVAQDEDGRDLQIGDPATVVDNGETYAGVVKRVGDNGRFELSFDNSRAPNRVNSEFERDEIRYGGDEDEDRANPRIPAMQAR